MFSLYFYFGLIPLHENTQIEEIQEIEEKLLTCATISLRILG